MWTFTPTKQDLQTSQARLLHRFKGHSRSVEAIAVHPDGSKVLENVCFVCLFVYLFVCVPFSCFLVLQCFVGHDVKDLVSRYVYCHLYCLLI